jgi:ABC-type Mn2+/Zn2+ transport system permease subunit
MVAALAFGFLAQQIYVHARHGTSPAWFDDLLFGQMRATGMQTALICAAICASVVVAVFLLQKEILAYCFDPLTARTSGVREGFIHYLLMFLLAVLIVVGVRVAGSVLVTALLVLPGAIALLVSQRLIAVMGVSVIAALMGAIGGLLINAAWRFLPVGPAIVLILVLQFAIAYLVAHRRMAA